MMSITNKYAYTHVHSQITHFAHHNWEEIHHKSYTDIFTLEGILTFKIE